MIDKIYKAGIIPVIKLKEIENAEKVAESLRIGGINCAEITFRAAGAEQVIYNVLNRYPDMLVGAGTVLTIQDAKKAVNAGAKFLVSPGFDEEVVEYALEQRVFPLPGCVTPTEILKAMKYGLQAVKFFPAAQYGGIATLKALAEPISNMKFVPTGGISIDNLQEYLCEKFVLACGGTFMVKEALIENKEWDRIIKLSQNAMEIIRKVRK